ncbi:Na+/H+ antiporter NhaA [Janibacter sp. G56]|uniref:Na+/H+ antiporter NhaA n=1 Tax=Janibacter sp. G56 TaxID=3418717 RepID=UPI003D02E2DA
MTNEHQADPIVETSGDQVVAHSWSARDTFVPRAIVRPMQRLMDLEVSTAIAVLAAAVLALVIANTGLQQDYESFWTSELHLTVGSFDVLHLSLRDVVNDGLMAIFFMVVALEIKREWLFGQLRDRRAAATPIIAALGGMIVPAGIYAMVNAGGPASHGWGIPMATDIAFAVAVLAAVPGVPAGARLFLLTLAIADDLGAIVVIAIFYAHGLSFAWLAAALGFIALTAVLARMRVRSVGAFALVGLLAWFCMHESGVHATIAGVAMGFLTPAWSLLAPQDYPKVARGLLGTIEERLGDGRLTHDEHALNHGTFRELARLSTETQSPLDRMEHYLSTWSAFVIVPIFAFANAGVVIPRTPVGDWLTDPVVVGVGLGLVLGKAIGVYAAAALATRLGLGTLPEGMTRMHLLGVAVCAGVGFTVAMFVANLAFPQEPHFAESAKLGIIIGSVVAGILGYLLLRFGSGRPAPAAPAAPTPEPAV